MTTKTATAKATATQIACGDGNKNNDEGKSKAVVGMCCGWMLFMGLSGGATRFEGTHLMVTLDL